MIGNFTINKIIRDDFGRAHGILAVDKPVGLSSHDVVYEVRRALQTKQVGHAGALDPFASGIVFIIVGRATKFSDQLMTMDKAYRAEVLIGISTDSQDTEGEIVKVTDGSNVSAENITAVLDELAHGYTQYVPVYSSVKINGQKLRVLARRYPDFETYFDNGKKYVKFKTGGGDTVIELPTHDVVFTSLTLDNLTTCKPREIDTNNEFNQQFLQKLTIADPASIDKEFRLATISTDCPKGTYIRQLAEDIGERLTPPLPAMLLSLRRTRIGDITINNTVKIDQLASL